MLKNHEDSLMNKKPLVAIIVLNYNGKECLSRALQSLSALSYERKEVIVVDNDSQDDSFERAKQEFPRSIFLQNSDNLGFAGGMNVGIREAERIGADYMWLFNNDATAESNALTSLISFCENHPQAGAVSPVIMNNQGEEWFVSGKISYFRMRAIHDDKEDDAIPYQSEYLSGCALLVPRSTFEDIGLLDERYFLYYEDADISLRIRQSGKKLFVVPTALVQHSERSEQENKKKIYYLVYSALLFFHDHTPTVLRPWMYCYELLRRMKNRIDMILHRPKAVTVYQAYQDYDRSKQSR